MTTHFSKIGRVTKVGLVGAAAALAVGAATTGTAGAAAQISASVSNGTLTVTGSEAGDRLALLLAPGAPGTLQVDFGDDGTADFEFDRATFDRIDVLTRNGDDRFRVNQVNGVFTDEAITVIAGNGDDILDGGDGAELFLGGPGVDAIDGNRGADTGLLGSGNDSFRWDPGDGSDVVEGGSGFDTLDFNGAAAAETMSLSANGERSLFVREPAGIRMDMDRVERLDLTTLGAVDTLDVGDMSGTDMQVVDVDLAGPAGGGDGADDIVTVNGTAGDDEIAVSADSSRVVVDGLAASVRLAASETSDQLHVNALDGNDVVDVADAAAALIAVVVDLGTGQA
jgi:hypothetical protein